MTEPRWISSKIVYVIHYKQIAEHGGRQGIRSVSLLESALLSPQNHFHYDAPKPSLPTLAAFYAYAISQNHPFVDGNKRVALVVSQLFLRLNGLNVTALPEDKYITFIKLASGLLSLSELISWFEQHTK